MLWQTPKNPTPISQETIFRHQKLIEKHAHKFPNGMPAYYVHILLACARKQTLYPHVRTREFGQKLMRQRMAKASHKAQLAKGLKLCGPANEAKARKRALKLKAKQLGVSEAQLRVGSSNLDGI